MAKIGQTPDGRGMLLRLQKALGIQGVPVRRIVIDVDISSVPVAYVQLFVTEAADRPTLDGVLSESGKIAVREVKRLDVDPHTGDVGAS